MLGAEMTKNKESLDENPRTSLFERIPVFIEKRRDDTDLPPSTICPGTQHFGSIFASAFQRTWCNRWKMGSITSSCAWIARSFVPVRS
jgi:hypothetical protein